MKKIKITNKHIQQAYPTTHYCFINKNIVVLMMVRIMIFGYFTFLKLVRRTWHHVRHVHTYSCITKHRSLKKKQNNKQANPTTPYSFKNKSIVVKMVVKIIIFGHFSLSTLATRATTAYTVPRTCRRKHCHEASLMKSSAWNQKNKEAIPTAH